MDLRFFISIVLFSFFSLNAYAFTRGNYSCSHFDEVKAMAKSPNTITETSYAMCLVIKGEDEEGLKSLHYLSKEKKVIWATYLIAEYEKSGGTLTSAVDRTRLNTFIQSFKEILEAIDSDPEYGKNGLTYGSEWIDQVELSSRYRYALLHMMKFEVGGYGTYNQALLESENYTGDKNLRIFPEYSDTLDSLEKTIKFADRCAKLTQKHHFDPSLYKTITEVCGGLRDLAQSLLPLEKERLSLLKDETCKNRLPDCPEYKVHEKELFKVLSEGRSLQNNAFYNYKTNIYL